MDPRRLADLLETVRKFQDRSAKWLFQQPDNMRELVLFLAEDLATRLDVAQMESLSTAVITRDFRERRSDLLLRVPYRLAADERQQRDLPALIWIYLLFEHQSSPDPLAPLRFAMVKLELWRQQLQEWQRQNEPDTPLRVSPVLPILFYTGERPWPGPLSVTSLMDLPTALDRYNRGDDTLTLKLRDVPPGDLEAADTPLAWVLRVWQEARAATGLFETALRASLRRLVSLLADDDHRLAELAYFLLALALHSRAPADRERAFEVFESEASVPDSRKERIAMGKTIADALIEEGIEKGIEQGVGRGVEQERRESVLRVLRHRFGAVPESVVSRIRGVDDLARLGELFDRALDVEAPEALLGD